VPPYGLVSDDPRLLQAHARGNDVAGERLAGWLEALDDAGIRPPVVVAHSIKGTDPATGAGAGADAAGLLLDLPQRPTTILCFSDVLALDVVVQARSRGLRVPEDLSVIGFDDAPLATRTTPALTTVRQDADAKGRAAAAALTAELARRADEPTAGSARCPVLPTELVIRDSTAPSPPDA